MTGKRDVLEISCKVLGLLCLIQGIPYMSSVAFMGRDSFVFMAWPLAFHLIAAFVLFKWARGIASLLVREDQPVEIKVDQGWQKPVYTLCLRVVGAVAIIRAVPPIIGAIIQIILRSRFGATSSAPWVPLIIHVASLALWIYFIGGAKEVVRIAMKGSLREPDSNNVKVCSRKQLRFGVHSKRSLFYSDCNAPGVKEPDSLTASRFYLYIIPGSFAVVRLSDPAYMLYRI